MAVSVQNCHFSKKLAIGHSFYFKIPHLKLYVILKSSIFFIGSKSKAEKVEKPNEFLSVSTLSHLIATDVKQRISILHTNIGF